MSQLTRIIELIRLTNQPGFILDGEREPLAVLPLAQYEKLVSKSSEGEVPAEMWSQVLQQQIDLWQQQQVAAETKVSSAPRSVAKKIEPVQPIHQPRPDLAEVMEEEIPDEYLPEPIEE
ncbi:MAG: hypothetical protein NTV81_03075 [Candidatus Komeilibacteria bacterium]|nr:hypothetical protein [Candidatus Komeilibacteria bacterium]